MTLPVSEKAFMQTIIDGALALGFWVYHTHNSKHSAPGYPDLTLVKNGRLIFVEVKTDKGKVSPAQNDWLDELSRTVAEVYVWRPSDWDVIEGILKGEPPTLRPIPSAE